jgi:hypothetical protein
VEEEALERRLKQEHIIEWLVNAVKTSVTPSQVRLKYWGFCYVLICHSNFGKKRYMYFDR